MTAIPHHCRCIVAGRLLLPHKTFEHGLRCRQFATPTGPSVTSAPTTRWARGWRFWNRCHGTLDIGAHIKRCPPEAGARDGPRNAAGLGMPQRLRTPRRQRQSARAGSRRWCGPPTAKPPTRLKKNGRNQRSENPRVRTRRPASQSPPSALRPDADISVADP
jgi:hypothetical protein